MGSVLFTILLSAYQRGAGLPAFFYEKGASLIGDFSNNLHYPTHEGGPYYDSMWASFPPLAYTFYYLINVCFTRANYFLELMAYLAITIFSSVLLFYAVQRIFNQGEQKDSLSPAALGFSLCVLMSGISIFTLERGNSVFNVMVMLLFVLYLRNSTQAWKREAALLLIALAAGMKIYPCLLGILYLLEKRYREAARLMIYGLLFFFVPFLWFGGLDGFQHFLLNQQAIHSLYRNDYFTSIPSIANFLAAQLQVPAAPLISAAKIIAYLFGAVMLVCVCLTKELWLRCLLLFSIAALVPGWSAEYMALYMVVPCALFMSKAHVSSVKNLLYTVLFGGIFVLLPFPLPSALALHAPLSWNTLVCFACLYFISFLAIFDILHTFFKSKKRALSLP